MKIHHIGIVARDIEVALDALCLDQGDILEKVRDDNQKNDLYFLKSSKSEVVIEIVVPLGTNSSTYNFMNRFQFGLHHLALRTDSIERSIDEHISRIGHFPLGSYEIEVKTFGGKVRTAFINAKGLLIEYVQNDG